MLSGNENAWTWFSGWGFITNLLSMSWNDAAMRSAYLLYLKVLPTARKSPVAAPCGHPDASAAGNLPRFLDCHLTAMLSIQKSRPNNPLVVGQTRRTPRCGCANCRDRSAGDLHLVRADLRRGRYLPGARRRRNTELQTERGIDDQ